MVHYLPFLYVVHGNYRLIRVYGVITNFVPMWRFAFKVGKVMFIVLYIEHCYSGEVIRCVLKCHFTRHFIGFEVHEHGMYLKIILSMHHQTC